MRKSEERFRAIFDQAFQFIGLMTTDGILIEANRAALNFYGITESDVLGIPFWEAPWWTHSPEQQNVLCDAVKRAASGEFVRFEAFHPAPDGIIHCVDTSIKPVKDETGNVYLLIPEGRDVTDRRQAEEALRESNVRFRNLTEITSDWIWEVDKDAFYTYVSPKIIDILGYDPEEIIGKTPFDLMSPKRPNEFLRSLIILLHRRSRLIVLRT